MGRCFSQADSTTVKINCIHVTCRMSVLGKSGANKHGCFCCGFVSVNEVISLLAILEKFPMNSISIGNALGVANSWSWVVSLLNEHIPLIKGLQHKSLFI